LDAELKKTKRTIDQEVSAGYQRVDATELELKCQLWKELDCDAPWETYWPTYVELRTEERRINNHIRVKRKRLEAYRKMEYEKLGLSLT